MVLDPRAKGSEQRAEAEPHLTSDKGSATSQQERTVFPVTMSTWTSTGKKINLDPPLQHKTKNESRWITDGERVQDGTGDQ